MKVSMDWLGNYVDLPSEDEFIKQMPLSGTEIEDVDHTGAQFDHVVVGQIIKKVPHPNSDHMYICTDDLGEAHLGKDGKPEPLQIVCGAQNFKEGDKVPVAMVGAHLPGGVHIKKSKLRGVESNGMNCSQEELGLGKGEDGIYILPADAPVGCDLKEYLDLSDTIVNFEPTPNRPDQLSIEGMARETGAVWRVPVKSVTDGVELKETGAPTTDLADVEITDTSRCARYTVRVVSGIKIGPSPDWLVKRIASCGGRSINNVVDATNYVMFLLGQPMHAFDFDKMDLEGGKAHIIVRPAKEGEKLTTLDGKERTLTPDMTVIASPKRSLALAGVMGGLDSEVSDTTTNVLLEIATFDPAHTSRTSRNLGLMSESSIRYERVVDAYSIERNANFAAALIAQLAGGSVSSGLLDVWPVKPPIPHMQFRLHRFCQMMGEEVSMEEARDILTREGCTCTDAEEGVLNVVAPTFRPDLEREIDLYEEVIRLHGMDHVPMTLPIGTGRAAVRTKQQDVLDCIHRTLQASGLNETMTYSFASPNEMHDLRMDTVITDPAVELTNPVNSDQSRMRQSIIPGLLRSVAYNQNHGVENIQLYETGNVFFARKDKALPHERQKLAGVLVGSMKKDEWNQKFPAFDFFDGKGVAENLIRELALPKARFVALDADEAPFLQPGRAAKLMAAGAEVGWVGEIHPRALQAFDARGPVVAFEFDLDVLVKIARFERDIHEVSEFPPVSVDVAFIVDEDVTNEKMMQRITSAGGKLLQDVQLFDVYRDDERVGKGKKSMAYSLTYQSLDRTLTGEEVEKTHQRLIRKVCGSTGAEVRS